MRVVTVLLLASASLAPVSLLGQGQNAPSTPQKRVQLLNTQDGGVRETLESIVVPPKPQAPFTLTLETEWVKTLFDGGTITFVNKRRIARDAAGRIYQERWALVGKDDIEDSIMTTIQISDPHAHTLYNCFLLTEAKTCELVTYVPTTPEIAKARPRPTGNLPGDLGDVVHEELGKRIIAGVETEGTHDARTYNPGAFGNDRKVTIEREVWYSPQLGLNLLSIRNDPRIGKQTFTVTNVVLADPDPALFEVPAGFKVVDRRQTAAPEPN
jgi:hypothetical protein